VVDTLKIVDMLINIATSYILSSFQRVTKCVVKMSALSRELNISPPPPRRKPASASTIHSKFYAANILLKKIINDDSPKRNLHCNEFIVDL